MGGPNLAAQAIRAGLVDEFHLILAPVVVGGGNRALPDDVSVELELLDERRFGNGMVYLRYATRGMTGAVRIREVEDADLPVFFANQSDEEASRLAAVPSRDQDAFESHWTRIRADPTVMTRTVLYDGHVAGSVLSFERGGLREVGYWIGRAYWGKGIATRALAALLEEDASRPLHARVAGDNVASVRVLEKCGFERIASKRVFDETRGGEIDDVLYVLR